MLSPTRYLTIKMSLPRLQKESHYAWYFETALRAVLINDSFMNQFGAKDSEKLFD